MWWTVWVDSVGASAIVSASIHGVACTATSSAARHTQDIVACVLTQGRIIGYPRPPPSTLHPLPSALRPPPSGPGPPPVHPEPAKDIGYLRPPPSALRPPPRLLCKPEPTNLPHVGRDREPALAADPHAFDADVPALDHLAGPKLERERRAFKVCLNTGDSDRTRATASDVIN